MPLTCLSIQQCWAHGCLGEGHTSLNGVYWCPALGGLSAVLGFNTVICAVQHENSGWNLLFAFLINSERRQIIWPDLLVFGAQCILSYNLISFPERCSKLCFLRGQAICGSSFWVFPIPRLPLPTPKLHASFLALSCRSAWEQHPLPGYSAFHAAQFLTCNVLFGQRLLSFLGGT